MLVPRKDSVIVILPKIEKITPGGIALPDGFSDHEHGKPRTGRIIAVGIDVEGYYQEDDVFFTFGYEVTRDDGEIVLVVKEDDIIAKVQPSKPRQATKQSTKVRSFTSPMTPRR
jgi:co-chaperonin GroES (HSP10)